MAFVHINLDAIHAEFNVLVAFAIKPEDITHA